MIKVRAWLAAPRRLVLSFVALLVLPAAAVVWLGVRWIQQDQALEASQGIERRQHAVDRAAVLLEQSLTTTARRLLDGSAPVAIRTDDDAVVIVKTNGVLTAQPRDHLLYQPLVTDTPEEPGHEFDAAERVEYQTHDYSAAVEALRRLTGSKSLTVQAGAWLRVARNLRRLNRVEEALHAYEALERLGSVAVAGLPADLVARRAQCVLLHDVGRTKELLPKTAALRADLLSARWRIDRGTFLAYFAETGGWLGDSRPAPADRVALAEAADLIAQRAGSDTSAVERFTIHVGDVDRVVLLRQSGPTVTALIAGPRFQRREWFDPLATQTDLSRFDVVAFDSASGAVLGPSVLGAPVEKRSAHDSGLPWTIGVVERDPASWASEFAGRRRVMMAALGVLALVVVAGGTFTVRAASRELAAAQLQSDFVSAVSHEFRTPLTSLRQFTDLLNEQPEPIQDKRRSFHQAQARATDRLQRLVEGLLDFGRMEAGARPYRPAPLDLTALVRRVVDDFRRDGAPPEFAVRFSSAAPELSVDADADAMARAIWNLLDNAVKYSGESRTVQVHVESAEAGATIAVRDEGIGISPGDHRRIFDKFVRGSDAPDHRIAGTGIGLAMVRHIVSAHGGRVTVESEAAHGSTFRIWLPIHGPAPADSKVSWLAFLLSKTTRISHSASKRT